MEVGVMTWTVEASILLGDIQDAQVVKSIIEDRLQRGICYKQAVIFQIKHRAFPRPYLRTKAERAGIKLSKDGDKNIQKGAEVTYKDAIRSLPEYR
jgi:hypothetical protein